tara:strand:+ start:20817 stop:22325 length:1509 start_codon:yes stop_codon:yes gene_type:complete
MAQTQWYMDIEVYLKETGATVPFTTELMTNSELLFEYGPYEFPINGIINLESFLEEINTVNYGIHNAQNVPFYYVYATPYLIDRASGFSNLTYIPLATPKIVDTTNLMFAPEQQGPLQRKLDVGGPLARKDSAFVSLAEREMLVRYDISLYNATHFKDQFKADYPGYEYYGFKIYWRTGPKFIVPDAPLGPFAHVNYKQDTDTVALDLPYAPSIRATIQDDSPLPPMSRIAPYQGISSKLLIMLNSNTGEYLARPVAILPEDLEKLANIYLNQKGVIYTPDEVENLINDPLAAEEDYALEYKKDDPTTSFQIFRTTVRPTSYTDFNTGQNPHATIVSNVSYGKQSDGASLVDDIEPNKKYYYCFRSLDVHNNFSNPTHVFEVEMMDNDGQVYIIIKTIEFIIGPQRSPSKLGRRFIYIEPSIANLTLESTDIFLTGPQTLDSITPEDVPPDNILGATLAAPPPGDEKVWDKQYKIRVTSTKTSRKFDLNLTFKNTGVKFPEG